MVNIPFVEQMTKVWLYERLRGQTLSALLSFFYYCWFYWCDSPVSVCWRTPKDQTPVHLQRRTRVFSAHRVILCHVQTGSSCGRTARCWSLRRTPPRRAVGGSGWNRGGGGPGDAGHRNLSCWQPVWTRLEDAEQDRQDRTNRQTWAWLFLYWKMFMTFQLIQSNETKCFGGNSAFACKTK